MPFLPIVLLVAWQAVSRSASFALGWATALYFGQVPGRPGRILAVISLLSLAWLIVLVGFWVPWLAGALLESAGVLGDSFDLRPLVFLGLVAASRPHSARSWRPRSCTASSSSVEIWRRGCASCRSPIRRPSCSGSPCCRWCCSHRSFSSCAGARSESSCRSRSSCDRAPMTTTCSSSSRRRCGPIGIERFATEEATGPKSWPMRTGGFAARHLLGAVVRGDPIRVVADGLEVLAYSTNVSILGPEEPAYRGSRVGRARGRLPRGVPDLERGGPDARGRARRGRQPCQRRPRPAAPPAGPHPGPDRPRASLNSEEWNVLYRLRLQVEDRAGRRHAAS